MTVFLTTQYLEEADVLADRVGIIDRGHIVAEGTPAALKARDRPRRRSRPSPPTPTTSSAPAEVLTPFGEPAARVAQGRRGAPRQRRRQLADVVRALDEAGIAIAHLQLHAPSLDDVFLAKTGRSLEGAGEDDGRPRSRSPA